MKLSLYLLHPDGSPYIGFDVDDVTFSHATIGSVIEHEGKTYVFHSADAIELTVRYRPQPIYTLRSEDGETWAFYERVPPVLTPLDPAPYAEINALFKKD